MFECRILVSFAVEYGRLHLLASFSFKSCRILWRFVTFVCLCCYLFSCFVTVPPVIYFIVLVLFCCVSEDLQLDNVVLFITLLIFCFVMVKNLKNNRKRTCIVGFVFLHSSKILIALALPFRILGCEDLQYTSVSCVFVSLYIQKLLRRSSFSTIPDYL